MDFKLMLVLSALGMTCGATIQDPYIHDSLEDQIAMESGQEHTVVAAPPHLRATVAENIADAPAETLIEDPAEVSADIPAEDASVEDPATEASKDPAFIPIEALVKTDNELPGPEEMEIVTLEEPAADEAVIEIESKPVTRKEVLLVDDAPLEPAASDFVAPARPLAVAPARRPVRPGFDSVPALNALSSRQPALSPLLLRNALLSRLQSPLQYGGFGATPVILLQPIIVPVAVPAREAERDPNALSEDVMSSLLLRQAARPRPLGLMDILQRGYYF